MDTFFKITVDDQGNVTMPWDSLSGGDEESSLEFLEQEDGSIVVRRFKPGKSEDDL
jgi:hypothetical protein